MKNSVERQRLSCPSLPDAVLEHRKHFENCLTSPRLVVDPSPSLVWWIADYVPPSQGSLWNSDPRARHRQVIALRNRRLWETKLGEALAAEDPPMEPRIVSVTTWKEGRLYDQGNFVQACKALLDSLQPDIILNDSLSHCRDFYSQKLAKTDKMPVGTLVVVHRLQAQHEGVQLFTYGETRSDPRQ